jgi:hypothetical protein
MGLGSNYELSSLKPFYLGSRSLGSCLGIFRLEQFTMTVDSVNFRTFACRQKTEVHAFLIVQLLQQFFLADDI